MRKPFVFAIAAALGLATQFMSTPPALGGG